MLLHCIYINIHHKVLFIPVPLLAKQIGQKYDKKRVAKCMKALNVYFMDNAATLHSYMHDIGEAKFPPCPSICSPSTS